MKNQIIAFYCIADDLAKHLHIREDLQCQMNTAEAALVGLTAALFFFGKVVYACDMLKEQNYIKRMLSKSRICRRLHKLPEDYLEKLMCCLGRGRAAEESEKEFTINSFPISVCHNQRINRCRIYQKEYF